MLCSFERPRTCVRAASPPGLDQFPVALAWGKHLFPFRTEQLSPTAPMVLGLHGPGRVGRRRFIFTSRLPAARVVKSSVPARTRAGTAWRRGELRLVRAVRAEPVGRLVCERGAGGAGAHFGW